MSIRLAFGRRFGTGSVLHRRHAELRTRGRRIPASAGRDSYGPKRCIGARAWTTGRSLLDSWRSRSWYGEAQFRTTAALNNLGVLLRHRAHYDRAEPIFRKAIAIKHGLLGDDHPSTILTHENLRTMLEYSGQHAEAKALHARIVPAVARAFATDDIARYWFCMEYARELATLGWWKDAREQFEVCEDDDRGAADPRMRNYAGMMAMTRLDVLRRSRALDELEAKLAEFVSQSGGLASLPANARWMAQIALVRAYWALGNDPQAQSRMEVLVGLVESPRHQASLRERIAVAQLRAEWAGRHGRGHEALAWSKLAYELAPNAFSLQEWALSNVHCDGAAALLDAPVPDPTQALVVLDEGIELYGRALWPEHHHLRRHLRLRARARVLLGDDDAASLELLRAESLWNPDVGEPKSDDAS